MEDTQNIQDLFGTSLPIDYEEQGDAWVEFLVERLTTSIEHTSSHGLGSEQASSNFPYANWTLSINVNPNETSKQVPKLKIVPVTKDKTKGVYLFLVSNTPLEGSDLEIWKLSIQEAQERLNEDNPEFTWSAAIAQSGEPMLMAPHPRQALRKKVDFQNLSINPGRRRYTVTFDGPMPHFNGYGMNTSWPILIEGKSKGFNWFSASGAASKDVHRVAAIISLVWGTTWELVHSPQPAQSGQLQVPQKSRTEPVSIGKAPKKNYRTLPKWTQKSFDALNSNLVLANALNAYYQGITMSTKHPSFALVAFVASIESVGKTIIGDKCSCCGKDNGAKQKFKAGLASVISNPKEVKRLTETYGARSDTAHEGVLHGPETSLGGISMPSIFNGGGDATMFIYKDLREINIASRNTLLKALRNISK